MKPIITWFDSDKTIEEKKNICEKLFSIQYKDLKHDYLNYKATLDMYKFNFSLAAITHLKDPRSKKEIVSKMINMMSFLGTVSSPDDQTVLIKNVAYDLNIFTEIYLNTCAIAIDKSLLDSAIRDFPNHIELKNIGLLDIFIYRLIETINNKNIRNDIRYDKLIKNINSIIYNKIETSSTAA